MSTGSDGTAASPAEIPTLPTKPAPSPAAAARTRLLLEGPIVATLLRLAGPNVVVNVVLIAVTAAIDAHFVGQLGPDALAGITLVFPLQMLMKQMANSSVGGATASAVARAIGAGRHRDASDLVVHGVVIAAGFSALFSSVVILGGPSIYALMGGSGAMQAAALEYSNTLFAGAFVYWLLGTLTGIVRGTGQAAVLAIVYVAAELLHVVLVPVLMFGVGPVPAMGITGAGLATLATFTASSFALVWYIGTGRTAVRLSLRDLTFSRRLFAEILRVGAPMSLSPIINNLSLAALTAYVGALGGTAVAAFGSAVRLEYLIYPLSFGLGAGLLSMVGTAVGAGDTARASRVAWVGAALSGAITGGLGLFALLAPGVWIGFFIVTPEVQALAATYLMIIGLAYPFLGLGLTLGDACQAAGRPQWPVLGVASRAAMVAGGGWVVIHVAGGGFTGLALVAAAGMGLYGLTLVLAVRSGAWLARTAASLKSATASG